MLARAHCLAVAALEEPERAELGERVQERAALRRPAGRAREIVLRCPAGARPDELLEDLPLGLPEPRVAEPVADELVAGGQWLPAIAQGGEPGVGGAQRPGVRALEVAGRPELAQRVH